MSAAEGERLVSAATGGGEEAIDQAIRPRALADYVGQEQVKSQLAIFIGAARMRAEALDHVLIFGPPGLGKTTLAHIIAAELEPKPAAQTYHKFLMRHGVDPSKAAMFEDLARNLVVPHQLGMTTVLVVPDGSKEVVREDWELEGRDDPYVDHVTDDLTGFLRGLVQERGS